MIVIFGENIKIPGVYDASDSLVNYHVAATYSRFQNELEERVRGADQFNLQDMTIYAFEDYHNTLKRLDEQYPHWSVFDARVVFFLSQLPKLVKEVKLLWLDTGDNNSDYGQALKARYAEEYDKFRGKKLKLSKPDQKRVHQFVMDSGTKDNDHSQRD